MSRSASTWKFNEFKELGILYKKQFDSLEYFSGIIEGKITDGAKKEKLLFLAKHFVECTEQYWTCTVDLDLNEQNEWSYGISMTITTLEFLDDNIVSMKAIYDDKIRSYLPSDTEGRKKALENFNSVFYRWRTNLKECMSCFHMILSRWKRRREELFTHLFTAFSRIAFLIPESGHLYNRSAAMNNETVNGMPDLRFETHPTFQFATPKLVVVTEVKQYDSFRGKWDKTNFTCEDNVSSNVLAQHGIELLLEMEHSLFEPNVFGFLCIGTKVIVTYLDITEHQATILKTGKLDSEKATICYSRPYDYMNDGDRSHILKLFFLFGFMQSKFLEDIF